MKCPECGDKCQFGKIKKGDRAGWDLMSLEVGKKEVVIGLHWNNESGGACSHFSVSRKRLVDELLWQRVD